MITSLVNIFLAPHAELQPCNVLPRWSHTRWFYAKKKGIRREYAGYSVCIPFVSDSLRCRDTYLTHQASDIALSRSSFICLLMPSSNSEHKSSSRAFVPKGIHTEYDRIPSACFCLANPRVTAKGIPTGLGWSGLSLLHTECQP